MSVKNLLGIYIPTYNRPHLLEKSLNSIIDSIKFANADGIPIYISDNSENVDTFNTVKRIKDFYPYIIYHKNKVNIGLDKNIFNVLKMGDTEFSWLTGDDDLFRRDAISKVLNVLNKLQDYDQINFIFVNYSYIDNEYKYILKEGVVPLKEDTIISSQNFVQKYVWAIGFIGSCIIRNNCINKKADCEYCGNYFPHIGVILKCSKGKKIYMIKDPIVLNRSENINSTTWGNKAFEVYNGFENTLKKFTDSYGEDVINTALKNSKVIFKHKSLLWIASKRADGVLNPRSWKEYIWNNPNYSISKKILSLPIAFLPIFLFKALKYLLKTLPQKIRKKPISQN